MITKVTIYFSFKISCSNCDDVFVPMSPGREMPIHSFNRTIWWPLKSHSEISLAFKVLTWITRQSYSTKNWVAERKSRERGLCKGKKEIRKKSLFAGNRTQGERKDTSLRCLEVMEDLSLSEESLSRVEPKSKESVGQSYLSTVTE